MSRQKGFSLFELMVAIVMIGISLTALIRAVGHSAEVSGRARRWVQMTAAVTSQLARLERGYRLAAPSCVLPAAGASTTFDGIGLTWALGGDSVSATITIEARAAVARRTLVDTVITAVGCQ